MKQVLTLFLVALTGSFSFAGEKTKMSAKVTKDTIDFYAGEQVVTRYHHKGFAKPIFWPVYSPGRVALTRAWPMDKRIKGETTDHIHQKSAWFCHGDVIPEGMELKSKIRGVDGVDFWSEAKGHGEMVCTEVGTPTIHGPGHVSIVTKNEWRTAEGKKIMDEVRVIHFVAAGDSYLIVVETQLDASVCTVVFGDTKEGSFGVRVNDKLAEAKNPKAKITNAEGLVGEKQAWGKMSAWCDYSGPIDGKTAGLAIFADPKNPYPACWHSRGYGLMAANPFGRAKSGFPAMKKDAPPLVRLEKGQSISFRFGILLHDGDARSARVSEQFARFVALRKP